MLREFSLMATPCRSGLISSTYHEQKSSQTKLYSSRDALESRYSAIALSTAWIVRSSRERISKMHHYEAGNLVEFVHEVTANLESIFADTGVLAIRSVQHD